MILFHEPYISRRALYILYPLSSPLCAHREKLLRQFTTMGKLKKSKRNQNRTNPLARGRKLSNETKSEESARRRALPLIEKLTSTSANDRAMALAAITVLCEDENTRKVLLKERIITIIMEQCLTDSDDEIVVEAFGVLRNIAVEEGYDVIQHIWRQNIWTAIEGALVKIQKSFEYLGSGKTSTIGNKKADEKARLQLLYDYTENVIMLVVVIASGSSKLFESVFAKIDPILSLVISIINWNTPVVQTSLKLHHALLDFVYEFASESQEFIGKLANFDLEIQNEKSLILTQIYANAIKFHIIEDGISIQDIDNILNRMFSTLVTINLDEVKLNLTVTDNAQHPIQKKPETMQDIDQPLGGELVETWQAKCNVQAMEIAIDVTTSIWELLATGPFNASDIMPTVFQVVYPSLMELLKFESSSNLGFAERLLQCLNNLCWLMLMVDPIPTLWHQCCLQMWDACSIFGTTNDIAIKTHCLNACWAICKAIGPEITSKINPAAINGTVETSRSALHQLQAGTGDPDLLTEWLVTAAGFLASAVVPAAHDSDYVPAVKEVGSLLVDCILWLVNGGSGGVMVECLNSLYDIFGDPDYVYDEPVFVQEQYLLVLQELEPKVKDASKRIDKHLHAETRARAEEACNNLTRFLQYKVSEKQ